MMKIEELLLEYNHLIEHDSYNCDIDNLTWDCWNRKYGMTIINLGILGLIAYLVIGRKFAEILRY